MAGGVDAEIAFAPGADLIKIEGILDRPVRSESGLPWGLHERLAGAGMVREDSRRKAASGWRLGKLGSTYYPDGSGQGTACGAWRSQTRRKSEVGADEALASSSSGCRRKRISPLPMLIR